MRTLVATAGVVISLAGVSAAQAQTGPWRSERPYRGLFGSGFGPVSERLTANMSLGAGVDNNILLGSGLRDFVGRPDFGRATRGNYGTGSAGLVYTLMRGPLNLGASASVSTRYYGSAAGGRLTTTMAGTSGVNAAFQFGRTRVSLSETISFRPYSLLPLTGLPTVDDTPELVGALQEEELVISTVRYRSHNTSAGVNQQFSLGRRGTIDLGYNFHRADVTRGPSPFWGQGGRVRYTHQITRDLGVYAGYRYNQYWYPGDDGETRRSIPSQSADLGVDFSRAFSRSLSRRLMLSVETGSSIFTRTYRDENRTLYRAAGSARLTREFGRTWATTLLYRRGVAYIETFGDPFLFDGVSASVGGLFGRRARFVAGADAIHGQVGLENTNPFDAYRGTAVLTIGLTRYVAAGTSYVYARYRFQGSPQLPIGSLAYADRHGARVFLTTFVPLYTRERRPDASR